MKLKYGVNDNLKEKYFPISLTDEDCNRFHSLEPDSISLYQKLKDQFKAHFKCNINKSVDLKNLIHCKQGLKKMEKFTPRFMKIWKSIKQKMEEHFIAKVSLIILIIFLVRKNLNMFMIHLCI